MGRNSEDSRLFRGKQKQDATTVGITFRRTLWAAWSAQKPPETVWPNAEQNWQFFSPQPSSFLTQLWSQRANLVTVHFYKLLHLKENRNALMLLYVLLKVILWVQNHLFLWTSKRFSSKTNRKWQKYFGAFCKYIFWCFGAFIRNYAYLPRKRLMMIGFSKSCYQNIGNAKSDVPLSTFES